MDTPVMEQTVNRRVVFYIPGFDPMPPNRYRELYRAESKKQADISGYEIDANRISTLNNMARFEVKAKHDENEVESEFRFLQWNDLVEKEMNIPIWQSWLGMFKVARVVAFSGALSGLLRLHFPPNIAGLYPFFMIPFQIATSIFFALAIALNILQFEFPLSYLVATIFGLISFALAVIGWRKLDGKLLAYYMLHDLMYICKNDGYTPDSLRPRLEKFKEEIFNATKENFDEILVIGHSSGAHLGVIVLAELLREGKITGKEHVNLLTLGHAIPLISYLPGARDLRLALDEISLQDDVNWVDFTAPSDGACFALHDPVFASLPYNEERRLPRVLSAAFHQYLSDEYYRTLRMRFFRLHFQYLCHFDKPGIYDYFLITSGPIRLWERFGELKNSPSMQSAFFNKFTDKAP